MHLFPPAMQRLIRELSRLPSIGEKSAIRLANHLVSHDKKLVATLAEALNGAQAGVQLCRQCFYFSESDLCIFCKNSARDASLICVVEKPVDVVALERTGEFKGLYHVLHGVWAPLRGQGPESIRIKELAQRIKTGQVREVILALGSTVEGDATSLYIARVLETLNVPTTRLAQGMPKGGELEFADEVTLSRAFSGRGRVG